MCSLRSKNTIRSACCDTASNTDYQGSSKHFLDYVYIYFFLLFSNLRLMFDCNASCSITLTIALKIVCVFFFTPRHKQSIRIHAVYVRAMSVYRVFTYVCGRVEVYQYNFARIAVPLRHHRFRIGLII